MRKLFEMLNRINHTPAKSLDKMDAQIGHKENVNVVIRNYKDEKTYVSET